MLYECTQFCLCWGPKMSEWSGVCWFWQGWGKDKRRSTTSVFGRLPTVFGAKIILHKSCETKLIIHQFVAKIYKILFSPSPHQLWMNLLMTLDIQWKRFTLSIVTKFKTIGKKVIWGDKITFLGVQVLCFWYQSVLTDFYFRPPQRYIINSTMNTQV